MREILIFLYLLDKIIYKKDYFINIWDVNYYKVIYDRIHQELQACFIISKSINEINDVL